MVRWLRRVRLTGLCGGGEGQVKRKVGTVLEEELLWKAKQTAAREKKTLSRVLEEALQEHLARLERGGPPGAKARVKETAGVLKVPKKVLAAVLQEPGVYEAG